MIKVKFNETTGLLDVEHDEAIMDNANKPCLSEVDAKSIFVTNDEMTDIINEVNKAFKHYE